MVHLQALPPFTAAGTAECIATTPTTRPSSMNASPSSATRWSAIWPAASARRSSSRCACRTGSMSSVTLASYQLRKLGDLARDYDRGYGHFTTRTNLQLNWPKLETVPDMLEELASVQMHAIQTSGNDIRNTTTDQFAGVAEDEEVDPRPWCELIRQWSTFHPEFAYLPRKFKIAVTGAAEDRAAIQVHDVGLRLWRDNSGEVRVKVLAGGGLRSEEHTSELQSRPH